MSRDVWEVLAEKFRELRQIQQQVACLRIVLPLLAEEGDKPPETTPEPKTEPKGWV
jgi:hypothetical protein